MLNKTIELFERLVVAVEKLAGSQGCGGDCECEKLVNPVKIEPINDIPRNYDGIAAQKDGLPLLKQFCAEKNIEVKKGSRATTLAKLLKEHDALQDLEVMEKTILPDEDTSVTPAGDKASNTPTTTLGVEAGMSVGFNSLTQPSTMQAAESGPFGEKIPPSEEAKNIDVVEDDAPWGFSDEQHEDKVEIDTSIEADDDWWREIQEDK